MLPNINIKISKRRTCPPCPPCPPALTVSMSSHIQSPNLGKDFESVELGELDKREEQQQQQREKVPRRIIHFSSGETMEEYSTDEDEAEEKEAERKDLLSSPVDAVRVRNGGGTGRKGEKIGLCLLQKSPADCTCCVLQSKLTWGPYFWFHMWRAATSTISGSFTDTITFNLKETMRPCSSLSPVKTIKTSLKEYLIICRTTKQLTSLV